MSEDLVRERYAEVSYPGGAFTRTHPSRHAAIAGLFGLTAPAVATARILEVGCAQGFNLLPLAARFPQARFVGVDFSAHEIERGRALATAAGLTNVELICADLRNFAPAPASFDYVIAHGVLSWVPDDVKNALFALCNRVLSPDGIACISYNTYPGWKQQEALRDLMLMRMGSLAAPTARLALARRTIETVEQLLAGHPGHHAGFTREIIASMKAKHPAQFYHDELDGVNDPCYFLQFTAWAAEHGLAYLAESEWHTMFVDTLPAAVRPALAALGEDRLMLEQHLDFLRNRTFRSSLLIRQGRALRTDPDPAGLRSCCFGTDLGPPIGLPPLEDGTPVRFGGRGARSFTTKDAVVKALFTLLAQAWPQRLAYVDLLPAARELLTRAKVRASAELDSVLPLRLLDACGRNLVDFLRTDSLRCATVPPSQPQAHALTRLMAAQELPVVNVWHEQMKVDEAQRALLARLDGSLRDFSPGERQMIERLTAMALIEAE